ncbi:MAG: helix-turn-helix transcriptional regulator [Oscillospiraceae bacterium]|nr:helix-turn-helix transcriptional regulator [Oscillospiraceae bacterium]MBP3313284.1 helix-turn-helix transcriptional regulator [Oscillospiraceae bacterium]
MICVCLERTLTKAGMTRYELAKKTGISYPIIDKYYKNKVTRYDRNVLTRICLVLHCDIADILEWTEET